MVDTSWLELFWGFLFDTSLLPPVFHGGEWKTVDDDESIYFVLPPARIFLLLCGSDTLIPFVGAVCLCPGTCVCLRLHLCYPWVVLSDARALVVLSRSLDRPFVTFRFICMAPVAFVIFGSASLISLGFLVTWPADNLHAWHRSHFCTKRDECVSVLYVFFSFFVCWETLGVIPEYINMFVDLRWTWRFGVYSYNTFLAHKSTQQIDHCIGPPSES